MINPIGKHSGQSRTIFIPDAIFHGSYVVNVKNVLHILSSFHLFLYEQVIPRRSYQDSPDTLCILRPITSWKKRDNG